MDAKRILTNNSFQVKRAIVTCYMLHVYDLVLSFGVWECQDGEIDIFIIYILYIIIIIYNIYFLIAIIPPTLRCNM